VVAVIGQRPGFYVAQRRVMAELERVSGFTRQGTGAFLGFGSYRGLMRELQRHDARIRVVEQAGGGTGVFYLVEDAQTVTPPTEKGGTDAARTVDAGEGPPVQRRKVPLAAVPAASPGPATPQRSSGMHSAETPAGEAAGPTDAATYNGDGVGHPPRTVRDKSGLPLSPAPAAEREPREVARAAAGQDI
jgi:hypothetical protein